MTDSPKFPGLLREGQRLEGRIGIAVGKVQFWGALLFLTQMCVFMDPNQQKTALLEHTRVRKILIPTSI